MTSTVPLPDQDEIDAYRAANVPLYNDQKLKLGIFGTNVSNGLTMTSAESTFRPTWQQNLRIARTADELGFELLVPVARWRGFGGQVDFNGESLETFTWAAGVAQATERAMVFATSHLPTIHPIVAAKMSTTVDQIAGGRFGLNAVMGWFTPEMEMFGAEQRQHDQRYAYGHDWMTLVKRLWVEDKPFDHDGEFLHVREAQAAPKPVQPGGPVLVNAGNSPAGIRFSAKHVDFNFATVDTIENGTAYAAKVREIAATEFRRKIGMLTYAFVICRDTEAEANAVRDHIIEKGDWDGAGNLMSILGLESQSYGTQLREFKERFILGYGGYPIIGTPEQVVEELSGLSGAGMDGVILGFLDYEQELVLQPEL
ncbi:luciferase [Actinomycetospora sp. NBRC 106375]|uniref:LLM class flavin-dependent oxidoreductase n=1 Tax=Actinomycetospora sp. NBRC 106375 TaxID=3032207 RepID=UPI0024A15DBF|nr:LLM class flavin-dependent oxidoreductase [Actinomycetospora sp. NBRC 106375]GLZ50362.1 luciferase [Actinomycetospora sp. NBRC 106375]